MGDPVSIYEAVFDFGLVGLVFGYIIYKAATTKPIDEESTTNKLEEIADEAVPLSNQKPNNSYY